VRMRRKRVNKEDWGIVEVQTGRTERKTIQWIKKEIKVKLRFKNTARQKERKVTRRKKERRNWSGIQGNVF
jgi:hypothetical protein